MSLALEQVVADGPIFAAARVPGAGRAREGGAALPDWAMAAVAAAENRVAELRARIEYLESLSVTDELTGLLNRRGFLAQLDRALAAAQRHDETGALLIVDLNGFKAVNDRYGHATGDAVLRQVGAILRGNIRRTDVVARLGGDEFAVLLIGTNGAGAARKMSALRALLSEAALAAEGRQLSVSASLGCAEYGAGDTAEALLDRADEAMYREKRRSKPGGAAALCLVTATAA